MGNKRLAKGKKQHNKTGTHIHNIFLGMISRCYYKSSGNYKWYGAKGIIIDSSWLNNFLTFEQWALENGYERHLTIDRINTKGNYEPNNCRWVDRATQLQNRNILPNNKSGYTGVYFDKNKKLYDATLMIKGIKKRKRFKSLKKAIKQRNTWIIEDGASAHKLQIYRD